MSDVFITSEALKALPQLRHGFFTRYGGVSNGLYDSLNCGIGSQDEGARVRQNRAIVAGHLGVAANRLVTLYQNHSILCVVVDGPFTHEPARADALVTRTPHLALAVATADCTPILLCDPRAKVIGAIHAGWRGATGGIVRQTVAMMTTQGARADDIVAVIGPTIRQPSYEVGVDVRDACLALDRAYERFFRPSPRGKALFDLPGLVAGELEQAGVGLIDDVQRDTYSEPAIFYSYRRMTHQGEADYGRHLSGIVLAG